MPPAVRTAIQKIIHFFHRIPETAGSLTQTPISVSIFKKLLSEALSVMAVSAHGKWTPKAFSLIVYAPQESCHHKIELLFAISLQIG